MLDLTKKLISFDTTQIENDAMKFIQNYVKNLYGDKLIYEKQEIADQSLDQYIIFSCIFPKNQYYVSRR